MMTIYYYRSNSGGLSSTYCVLGILLMILLLIVIEDLLYVSGLGCSRHRRFNSERDRHSLCFHDSYILVRKGNKYVNKYILF